MANEHWSEGRSRNAAKGVPGSSTDCSGWEADIPAEMWSEGRSVNAAKGVPGSVTDCSNWDRKSPAWIVVHVTYSPTTPKAVVSEHTFAVIRKLQELAPDLGLEFDEERSDERADKREVTIAISPTVLVADLVSRLEALIPNVRKAIPKVPIIGLGVRWDGKPLAA